MNFNDYKIPETYGVSFEVTYINVGDHYHRVATAGNPSGIPVIVMMGVFEDLSLIHISEPTRPY